MLGTNMQLNTNWLNQILRAVSLTPKIIPSSTILRIRESAVNTLDSQLISTPGDW